MGDKYVFGKMSKRRLGTCLAGTEITMHLHTSIRGLVDIRINSGYRTPEDMDRLRNALCVSRNSDTEESCCCSRAKQSNNYGRCAVSPVETSGCVTDELPPVHTEAARSASMHTQEHVGHEYPAPELPPPPDYQLDSTEVLDVNMRAVGIVLVGLLLALGVCGIVMGTPVWAQ